jgi:drug/metabolite transporter (DMT)-like permease
MPAIHLGAAALASCIWGAGSVVARLGVYRANPLLFALLRDSVAGPLLCAVATARQPRLPRVSAWRVFACGACVFCDQCFNVVGIHLSSSTTSALWQPTQPIITCVIALAIGQERFSRLKAAGIALGASGAMFVAVYGAEDGVAGGASALKGSLCFLVNCTAAGCYAIVAKPLLQAWPALSVTGWAYLIAALLTGIATAAASSSPAAMSFLGCTAVQDCTPWAVPRSAWWPLCYFVFANSMLAYALNTWAIQHTPASVVTAFAVLQPVASILLSLVLVLADNATFGPGSKINLDGPQPKDAAIVAIIGGLLIVCFDEQRGRRVGAATSERFAPLMTEPLAASAGGAAAPEAWPPRAALVPTRALADERPKPGCERYSERARESTLFRLSD